MSDIDSASTPVTVVHVVLGLRVGGLERVVVNLARGLHGSRWRVIIACLDEGGPFVGEAEAAGVRVRVLGRKPGVDLSLPFRLARFLRGVGASIVHTHNPAPHLYGVIAGLLGGIPVRLHTKHGRNYPDNPRYVRINRMLSCVTDMIVPVSDDARDVALEVEGVAPSRVRRISNGVDTELYCPNTNSMAGDARRTTIGCVARLSPEKDLGTLLQAFQLVHRSIPDAWLALVGDGPCDGELKREAVKLGIAERVVFHGARADIPNLMREFSLFTLSSTTEGMSMTLLEAMASGIPIVATDVGGNREIVNPPECGLIVPPRDPVALAAAYLSLLRRPEDRITVGVAARKRAVEFYGLKRMIDSYAMLYEELLHAKGK